MDRRRIKFVVLGSGIVLSMAFLVLIGMNRSGGFDYYLTVSEFLAQASPVADAFRINGKVQSGSIQREPMGQEVRFVMTDGSASLSVHFQGIIPDTFVDGADVVVKGRLEADGTLSAHTLLAKCPSKYESADGQDAAAVLPAGEPPVR